jgi:hypothetical protein
MLDAFEAGASGCMGADANTQASSEHLESPPRGRGIGNMQARAAALGAQALA